MALTLVVEDGTGKPDANSFATVATLRGYAQLRGVTLPTDDDACAIFLIKSWDAMQEGSPYLRGACYHGERATKEQAGPWPRVCAVVEGWRIASDEIPRQVPQAQCALACDIATNGTELLPTQQPDAAGPITQETIGPITTVYANNGTVGRVPAVASADALLRTLLRRNGLFVTRA